MISEMKKQSDQESPGINPKQRHRLRWSPRRLRFLVLLIPTILGTGLLLAHRPILVGFAYLFRVDNPAPSDVLVVLLGGTPHRPEKAAELFHKGIAPRIVLCRERPDPVFHHDASLLIKEYLIKLGVPPVAIEILPDEVTSTKDEAERVLKYLKQHPSRRITIVTTAFHTARARWIFQRILSNQKIDIRAAAAKDPNFDESNWYQNEEGLIFYFNELIKTIYYRMRY